MKKTVLILFISLFSSSVCFAQIDQIDGDRDTQKNAISFRDATINGIEILGNDLATILQHFGQPETIEDFYSETEDITKKKYCYAGLVLYVFDDLIDSFEITDGTYEFTNHNIKIGDDLSVLQSIYPLSYSSRRFTSLGLDFEDIDGFVVIFFDFNNKITSIRNGVG